MPIDRGLTVKRSTFRLALWDLSGVKLCLACLSHCSKVLYLDRSKLGFTTIAWFRYFDLACLARIWKNVT